ncbi:MAG: flagellar hook-associated protein FlgK [Gammaproteobacteria bacterium]|nr:flagellar hook-associated protein FlgK [Gammaproteobacteria bacterium]
MAGFGVLNVAVSGLVAANRAMTTIGHNVANVNTEGYSRQRVDIQSRPPQLGGGSFVGAGVNVVNTRRLYDTFAVSQQRVSSASVGYADSYHELARSLDNLLADPDTGLNTPLQAFFNATHDLANDPASPAARQALLAEAENLTARFHTLDQALSDLDRRVNQGIADAVAEVNSLTGAIAEVNHDILLARGRAQGAEPNDLLDQRDELVRQLASKVNVAVIPQDDGTINVATGSGQALVAGTQAATLVALPGAYDASRVEIGFRSGNQTANVTGLVSGGELGALVTFRAEMLDSARNALGRVAAGLTQTFNAQHRLGYGLDGQTNRDFFRPVDGSAPEVLGRSANQGTLAVTATVANATGLATSDYLLEATATGFTLTRVADGRVTDVGALGFPGASVTVDGVQLAAGAGTAQVGDRFLVRPVRLAARDFGLSVTAPAQVAAAGGPSGRGDNENALALSALRNGLVLDGGNATYEDAYGALVVEVGTRTRQAEINQAAQKTLLDEATRLREAASGVNLDEEAADLMRFQQSYQASAQVVATANLLFDTLLQAVTR